MTFETLHGFIRWVFMAHVLAGAVALGIFLVPLVAKKGGRLHVRTGWVYTFAMGFVALSAFVITPWRAFYDPERDAGSIAFAVFLAYISVFTLTCLSHGLNTLRQKKRAAPSRSLVHLGPPLATVIAGVITQLIGLKFGNFLLMAFPFLGHLTARGYIQYWSTTPKEHMHWWYAHMDGMFIACIATLTAFLVTAGPRLWPSSVTRSPWLWIAPGLILGTVLNRWTARYQKKFERSI